MTTIQTASVLAARADTDMARPDRFTYKTSRGDGATVYSAQHELHNTVDIVFPAGYWGDTTAHPLWIDMDFDIMWPEYREPPRADVVRELQHRLPNLHIEDMYPGFVVVNVPHTGILACGGDSDGWRIEHQDPGSGQDFNIPTMDPGIDTYCQDINVIVTQLINTFRTSPWAEMIFGYVK